MYLTSDIRLYLINFLLIDRFVDKTINISLNEILEKRKKFNSLSKHAIN
jgi:hypothetical protein